MNQLARCQGLESAKQGGYQRPEGLHPVRGRDENDHGDWEHAEVLLLLKMLIRRQKGVESANRQPQQFAVLDTRPTQRRHGTNFVLGQ